MYYPYLPPIRLPLLVVIAPLTFTSKYYITRDADFLRKRIMMDWICNNLSVPEKDGIDSTGILQPRNYFRPMDVD